MKKLFGIFVVLLVSKIGYTDPGVGTEPLNAGWNFGNITQGSVANSLVLNSLSDNYGISQFNTTNTNGKATQVLGSNDYVQEAGVTNMLAIEGYSNAYTYDPQYTGLYASAYNQPLPTNVPLTELSFMGLAGNPNAIENIYVPTAQYNELSVQGVNGMLDPNTTLNQTVNGNTTAIANETVRAEGAETSINNMSNPNTVLNRTVNGNTVAIANETVRAETVETSLATGLNQTNAQVNTNTANIGALNTGLNNETLRAQGAESGLQNQINQVEKVKVMADMTVRILDEKKYTVGFFDMWDGTNNRNFAFGARLTYKLGKSYEERLVEKQQKQIEDLQRVLRKIADEK